MRQFLRTIPAVRHVYGHYRLRRYRQIGGPEVSRLAKAVPPGVPPLTLANSLREFEGLVRHPLFPADLIERLMPSCPGRAIDRAFVNFTEGCAVEQALAGDWQQARSISEASERRLTEFLNRYITYALRTFGVYLEMRSHPQSPDSIRIRRTLGELENEEGALLDIGCAFVPLAERYTRLRRWIGLDLSLPSVAIGRIVQNVPAAALVCGYSENLPFPDGCFDVVVSSEVLEHTPRPQRMVAEIARVLRAGGKAVLTVPMHIVDFQNGRQHLIGPTDSTHRFRFYSLDGLRQLFQEHGLTVVRLQSDPHYVFTLRRGGSSGIQAFRRSGVQVQFRHSQDGQDFRDGQDDGSGPVRSHPVHPCEFRLNTRTRERVPAERLTLACPDCRGSLEEAATLRCPACETQFMRRDGVPVLLPRHLRSARLELAG